MSGISTKGLTETLKMLEKIEGNTDSILEDALKEGIGVVTDEMRAEIQQLKSSDQRKKGELRLPSKKDIKGLLDSLGYTPVKDDGAKFNVKAGFDGYNDVVTDKYPRGHSNQMIANSINKGTSFMQAQPFINRTKKASQANAIDAIQKKLDKEIDAISK